MRDQEQHLSDEELILAADSELGRKTDQAGAHLRACAQCRKRAAAFERVMTELACAQRDTIDCQLPSVIGPRARLRARLSETAAEIVVSRSGIFRDWLARAVSAAALAALVVFAAVMVHHNPPASLKMSVDAAIRPNHAFTPGIARHVSLEMVCSLSHEEVITQVSPLQRQRVFEEYGIPLDQSDKYEVDYLIAPGLGGEDDLRNLWPEPYKSLAWNAYVKDILEERLHELVCSHQVDLLEAQEAIATDWIAAYEKYVPTSQSKSPMLMKRTGTRVMASMQFPILSRGRVDKAARTGSLY